MREARLADPPRQQPHPAGAGPAQRAPSPAQRPLPAPEPLHWQLVHERPEAALWNEFLARYHPLGYRQPLGCHLRSFLEDRQGRRLGCLLYDFADRYMTVRDRWSGLCGKPVSCCFRGCACLASKVLGLSLRQLASDWQREHGVRLVLVETYVSQPYAGTCYRASNWHYLEQTQACGAMGKVPAKTPKAVFVYPLQRDWQAVLLGPSRPAPSR